MSERHPLASLTTPFAALALCLGAAGAAAGPWPQEKGAVFVSSGVEIGFDEELYLLGSPLPVKGWSSLYTEYGLTRRVTLVFDYGRELDGIPSEIDPPEERGLVILRYDLAPEAVWRRAVSAGLGYGTEGALQHLGFHLGRGFDSRFGSGWMTADFAARTGGGASELGLDMVAGLNRTEKLKLMAGAQVNAAPESAVDVKLTAAMAVSVWRFDVEMGVIAPLGSIDESRLKFSVWQKF